MTPEEIVKQRILKELEHMLVDQIKLAILNEREACAKIAENMSDDLSYDDGDTAALKIAQAIRQRGEK